MLSTLPRLIGHRGAKENAPENTLASIREAARQGARWVELDVMLSRDQRPVIIHDDTLDRTTSGTGPVPLRDVADLRALDAGTWFDPRFAGEPLPTLEEAAALKSLDAELLAGSNKMKLFVFADDRAGQVRLVAALDNLGKGAGGAAVQNMNIMLGLPETTGL